jgi:hypothetical protein
LRYAVHVRLPPSRLAALISFGTAESVNLDDALNKKDQVARNLPMLKYVAIPRNPNDPRQCAHLLKLVGGEVFKAGCIRFGQHGQQLHHLAGLVRGMLQACCACTCSTRTLRRHGPPDLFLAHLLGASFTNGILAQYHPLKLCECCRGHRPHQLERRGWA